MTDDVLLSEDDIECALSVAYVQAIAAMAGYTCGEPPGPDRDSIDIQIAAGGHMRPKIDAQLKATIRLQDGGDALKYPLKIKNYNDLRESTQTPRILIVLDLPRNREEWLRVSLSELIISRAAYWCSLAGYGPTANTNSVTISIPKSNAFDVKSLNSLMELSRKGSLS